MTHYIPLTGVMLSDEAATAPTVGRCRDCRHWGKIRQQVHGVCCWLSLPRSGPAHEAPNADTLAVLDPTDAYIEVEMLTMPDFGCVLFEPEG